MVSSMQNIAIASRKALATPRSLIVLLGSWVAVLSLYLLISRLSVITHVLWSTQYSIAGKLSFLAQVYANFFVYILNPIVFTAFLFTGIAALNITLLIYMTRVLRRQASSKGSLGAAGTVIASHVLSCGSSLLAPFFSALAGSSAYNDPGRLQISTAFGVALNIIGLILILRSTASVARHINAMEPEDRHNYSDYLGVATQPKRD